MLRRFFLSLSLVAAIACSAQADIVITQWDFNDQTTDPSTGFGTISTIGGATTTGFNSGSGSSDPVQPGSAFQTTTYPAQGQASGTAGIRVDVDTTGFFDIKTSFDLRTSNTASRWYQIQYTTDGSNFMDFGGPVRLERFNDDDPPVEIGVGDFFSNQQTFDFSGISGVDNNPNFGFQVVSVFSPVAFTEFLSGTDYAANTAYEAARNRVPGFGAQSNYAGGTWRFDMVTVTGVPEPTAAFALAVVGLVGIARRRR